MTVSLVFFPGPGFAGDGVAAFGRKPPSEKTPPKFAALYRAAATFKAGFTAVP
jgi:hypothetical protein